MSNIINDVDKLLGALDIKTEKTYDIEKILNYLSKNQDKHIIINLPFDNYINGEFYEYLPVIVQRITKEKLYFVKTFKTTYFEINKEGLNKTVSQEDSIDIKDLIELSSKKPIIAFLEN
jgi:hypothetical protein